MPGNGGKLQDRKDTLVLFDPAREEDSKRILRGRSGNPVETRTPVQREELDDAFVPAAPSIQLRRNFARYAQDRMGLSAEEHAVQQLKGALKSAPGFVFWPKQRVHGGNDADAEEARTMPRINYYDCVSSIRDDREIRAEAQNRRHNRKAVPHFRAAW